MTATPERTRRPGARRPLRTLISGTLLLLSAIFADDLYGAATASGRVSPELAGAQGRVHVVVELPFEPERYHLERLSQYGSYAGRAGERNLVALIRVTPDNLDRLSRLYWVNRIEPLQISG